MNALPPDIERPATSEPKVARLEVTGDPAGSMAIGDQIYFRDVDPLWVDAVAGVQSVKNWEAFRGAMLAVGFGTPARVTIQGSAVIVAPGIALCARHVVEPFQSALASGAIGCFGIGVTGPNAQYWRLRTSTLVDATDIAILAFELGSALAPGDTVFKFPLSARIPKLGDTLMLCGFRAARDAFDGTATHNLLVDVLVSTGVVSQHFLTGRDRMLPGPSLEVTGVALGGMSGGPAFDKTGHVVGLVTSSVAPENEPTFVSLAWPVFGIKFPGGWPAPLFTTPHSLFELGAPTCHIDGRELFSIGVDASGAPTFSVFMPN